MLPLRNGSVDAAMAVARESARVEGLPCGISGGAAIWAALEVARREGIDSMIKEELDHKLESVDE